jgi:sulfonate transport system permease protein
MAKLPSDGSLSSRRLLPWIIPLAALLAWLLVAQMKMLPPYLMPSPQTVVQMAHSYLLDSPDSAPYAGRFVDDARASLLRVLLGFTLAAALAIPLGLLSGRRMAVNRLFSTTINSLRAVPGISWLPLAMVWFGIGLGTTVFLIALASFFPIYLNTAEGARRINPLHYRSGAMMGVGPWRGVFFILLPAAMPHIMTGLRLGLGLAWAYLVLGELTGVEKGLGAVIMDARMLGRIDMIMVGILIIAAMGRLSDVMLKSALRLCFKSARRLA